LFQYLPKWSQACKKATAKAERIKVEWWAAKEAESTKEMPAM
jgi:hypothetical protein